MEKREMEEGERHREGESVRGRVTETINKRDKHGGRQRRGWDRDTGTEFDGWEGRRGREKGRTGQVTW